MTIQGAGGNDTLTVDAGGEPGLGIGGLVYDAGSGVNSLTLKSGAATIDSTAAGGALNTTVAAGAHLSTSRLQQNALSLAGANSRVTILPGPGAPRQASVLTSLDLAAGATLDVTDNGYGLDNEVGQRTVLTGYGATGHGATGIDEAASSVIVKRAGLNRYDAVRDESVLAYDFDSGQDEHNALAIFGFTSDLGFGVDEALSAHGDSGAPIFIDGAIAGIAASIGRLPAADFDDVANTSWGEAGFDTRVSSFQEFILSATDGEAVFIPEPSDMRAVRDRDRRAGVQASLTLAQTRRAERK